MSRRRRAEKRLIVPDAKYSSVLVGRLVNTVMQSGKKNVAQRIVYGALDQIAEKSPGASPIEVLQRAVDNAKPRIETKARRVGGATYQVPLEVSNERQTSLAMRWMVTFANNRRGQPMKEALAAEVMDAYQGQGSAITAIEILTEVSVEQGEARATLRPSASMKMRFDIEFPDAAIGRQSREMDLCNGHFVRELCDSRTFCRQADVEFMQANGLALGGVPGENAVVVDGDYVTSPGGLRHADEPVRHKMLDALGDLGLAGAPVLGEYEGVRAGHMLTNQLLRKLFATPGAWRMVECTPDQAAQLPGVDLHPEDLSAVA